MSASTSLSVELWQTILRYAIGVADFLDPDAFKGVIEEHLIADAESPKNNEATYWAAERTRNQLQMVCKSWDAYLRNFEHRFVRMLDIYHDKIDIQKLEVALRVCFSPRGCRCVEFCTPRSKFQTFCWKTIGKIEPTRMVIADLKKEDYPIGDLIEISQNFDRVEVLIAPYCGFTHSFAKTLQKFSSLRHFYGKGYRGIREQGVQGITTAKNIITLSLHTRMDGEYTNLIWDLPCLRHFRLKDDSSQELSDFVDKAALPILRVIGVQLLSLHLYHRIENYDMPRELWELCPNVESFRIGMSLVHHPPYFHPIHTLVVVREVQLHQFPELPEWPNLRRVVIDNEYPVSAKYFSHLKSTRGIIMENRNGFIKEADLETAVGGEEDEAE
ncbi:hypothetical protein M408DRAFT_332384 [Serendipita vermifera MAFF 305830]|uniref:F-box domain-containing protein n=1 Tax=Serendipita vermifera MAFF 305830 TaxID=933852 RepID=A0A0C3AFC7_SERVB|nr:hypothetical protein M408DRAFT_332384 [Serendipita vermifera MAFF 305830]